MALDAGPRRNVALQITRKHARLARTSYAARVEVATRLSDYQAESIWPVRGLPPAWSRFKQGDGFSGDGFSGDHFHRKPQHFP